MAINWVVRLVRPNRVVARQVQVACQDANVTVPHQPLEHTQVSPCAQHPQREGVAEMVRIDMQPSVLRVPIADILHCRLPHRVAVEG